jgi:hypothetical protein
LGQCNGIKKIRERSSDSDKEERNSNHFPVMENNLKANLKTDIKRKFTFHECKHEKLQLTIYYARQIQSGAQTI